MLHAIKRALAALVLTGATGAFAGPVTQFDTWHTFDVDTLTAQSGGREFIDIADGSALTFSFTAGMRTVLQIVDGGFGGDIFRVKLTDSNGATVYDTGAASNTYPDSLGLDFDAAWGDARFSRLAVVLEDGMSYTLSGELLVSALDDTGAPIDATVGALRLTVPEPGSLDLMLLAAFGLIGSMVVRARK